MQAAALKFAQGYLGGMSAVQITLAAGVGAAALTWRQTSAAALSDHMETQVYVSACSPRSSAFFGILGFCSHLELGKPEIHSGAPIFGPTSGLY